MLHSDPSSMGSSTPQLPQLQRIKQLCLLGMVLATVGLADASFLATKYLTGGPVPCGIGRGCDVVTRSTYAHVGGVPVSLIGAAWYLVLLIAWFVAKESDRRIWATLVACATVLGATASMYFVYLMLVVLKAVCTYCMLSAFINFTMLGVGSAILYAMYYSRRAPSHQ